MQWAPDSPDLWAPDAGRPNRWAPDTFEHLTFGRGADLFLGAKAAEGASPKTITWYRMILMQAVAAFGADHPIDRVTGPALRAWLVELRTTLAPVRRGRLRPNAEGVGNWREAGEAAARVRRRDRRGWTDARSAVHRARDHEIEDGDGDPSFWTQGEGERDRRGRTDPWASALVEFELL
jgi:hypothetical protein